MSMDIKQELRQTLDSPNVDLPGCDYLTQLCQKALAEIERLEVIRDRCRTGAERVLQHGNKDPIGLYGAALRAIVDITSGKEPFSEVLHAVGREDS